MNYEIVSAGGLKHVLYHQDERQLYRISKRTPKKVYYTCRFVNCLVKGELSEEIFKKTHLMHVHNHPEQENEYLEIKLTHDMRLAAQEGFSSGSQLFATILAKPKYRALRSLVNFKSKKSIIRRSRLKTYPKIPELLKCFEEILMNDDKVLNKFGLNESRPFFYGRIESSGGEGLVFAHDHILKIALRKARRLLLDGTFAIAPSGATQVVIVHFEIMGTVSKEFFFQYYY